MTATSGNCGTGSGLTVPMQRDADAVDTIPIAVPGCGVWTPLGASRSSA
jgi:hypothetical protein